MNKIFLSCLISLLVNGTGAIVNYLYFRKNRHLLFSFRTYGGEFMGESAFGLFVSHIYAMHPDGHDSHTLRFSLILFLLYFLVIAVLVYLLVSLIGKLKQR